LSQLLASNPQRFDVAVVGGGPAGSALAMRLASAGVHTVVVERSAEPRWRASGVFSSPLTRHRLADLGMEVSDIADLHRPISALNLESTRGGICRIEYERGYACGFDRVRLDAKLLDMAGAAGADVRRGVVMRSVQLSATGDEPELDVAVTAASGRELASQRISARVVVGADGPGSLVARAAGVHATSGRFHRSGVTFHREDAAAAPDTQPMEGRFLFGRGWYVGIAPVPGARVNVGIVVPPAMLHERPELLAQDLIKRFPPPAQTWMTAAPTDAVAVAGRLEHHATRAAGPGWLLVGDALGFIDPLTGEGLQRAFVTAELAAAAIVDSLRGDPTAFQVYDRRVRAKFRSKNVVSWVLQAFLARPQLFDYALRRLELTLVLTDQLPASNALDPRFLLRLLAP
jgi:flavin-dependent dehydrogenase